MLDIFLRIFNTILPPRDCILEIKKETPEEFTRFFSPHIFNNCIVLADYTNPKVKAAINANKFYNYEPASELLATLVDKWLDSVSQPVIFIPIPLSNKRQRDRGYNQTTRIISKMKPDNTAITEDLLIRSKDTVPQTKLKRQERLKNMNDVFSYQDKQIDLSGYQIVIIDDVVTTGATMQSAYKTLKEHLPKDSKITCLALAH